MRSPFKPGKDGVAWKVVRPAFERARHFNSVFLRVMHDGRAWIWREDVCPELRAWKTPAHIEDEGDGLPAIVFVLARIRKDDVERRTDARLHTALRRKVDGIKVLKCLVHQPQNFGRCGIDSLADLVKPGTPEKPKFVNAESSGKVCGRLNAPAKGCSRAYEALSNCESALLIHEEVVVYDPEHLQTITARQVEGLFDDLLGRKTIPLPPVNSGIRTVGTIERAREARRIHCPAPPAQPCVGVEVRKVISLGRHFDQWTQGPFRIQHQEAIPLESHTRDLVERLSRFEVLYDLQHGTLAL